MSWVNCLCRFYESSTIVQFALLSILWVQNFFLWKFPLARIFISWVYRGYKRFSRGYFVGPKFFLVGISWVRTLLSWVFCGSNFFYRGYFHDSKIFSCWLYKKNDETQKYKNISQTAHPIPNQFQQWSVLIILGRYFIN